MKPLALRIRAILAILLTASVMVAGPASAAATDPQSGDSYDDPRYADAATLAIEGTIETIADTQPGTDQYAYAVRTDEGVSVALPASFGDEAPAGGHFEGELVITRALADDLRAEGVTVDPGESVDADSPVGETVTAAAAEQPTPMPVASATVTEPVAEAASPSDHRAYVAVMTNRGALPSDSAIDANLSAMTQFWDDEAGDAITSFTIASTVKYSSAVADADTCGLQNGNWGPVWDEALGKFPSVAFGAPGNHLIVAVPSSCVKNGAVGIGTVGSSLADGGKSIVVVGASSSATQIAAHEIGHNVGLGHANLQYCATESCAMQSYANMYSVMGFASGTYEPPSLDSSARRSLDLADQVQDVTHSGEEATTTSHALQPRSATSGLRGLRVVDPNTGDVYFVDYRSGTGRDAASFYAAQSALGGLPYRYAPGIVITQQLPDTMFGDQTRVLTRRSGSLYVSSLAPGDTYTSPNGTVEIAAGTQGASADVAVVLAKNVVSAAPTLSATPRVLGTLFAVTTGWDPDATLAYQWRINGTVVGTAASFTMPIAYVNTWITLSVTGTRPGLNTVTRSTEPIRVAPGYLASSAPRITGTPKVGKRLKVAMAPWTSGTTYTYRWYANGRAISKATKSTYKITKSKKGKRITVKATGRRWAFYSSTRTSASTAKVR